MDSRFVFVWEGVVEGVPKIEINYDVIYKDIMLQGHIILDSDDDRVEHTQLDSVFL